MDTFKVDCPNLGSLTRVRIRHDNKGIAAGWFLDKVSNDNENDNNSKLSFLFSYNKSQPLHWKIW